MYNKKMKKHPSGFLKNYFVNIELVEKTKPGMLPGFK